MNPGTLLRALLGVSALTLIAPPAGAQTAGSDTDERIETIDTVTIIGRRADVADVPGSAHVVDSQELNEFLQTDIMRVLRTVPGVYLQEEDGFGIAAKHWYSRLGPSTAARASPCSKTAC